MKLPDEFRAKIAGKNVIVFDGLCVLCNGWVQFVLRFDAHSKFHFVIAQSKLGEAIYAAYGLKSDDYDTFIVFTEKGFFTKLDGVFALFHTLGWPWRCLSAGRVMPRILKDACYSLVAKNRYKLFGKRETCMLPNPEIRARFLD